MTTIGIVSPGAMGSALGRAWTAGGARVVATVAGRSERTRGLANGLSLLPSLADVVREADVVVSVCPPDAAADVLADVLAAAGDHRPVIADVNAVSPDTVSALESRTAAAGFTLVDGSISGGPPSPGGDTMLYLSGSEAALLADLPADGLRTRVVGERAGTASAVKMCTASVYKGTTAVWAQALQTAYALGVLDVVLDDLREEHPDEVARAARRIAMSASKAHRFVGEMEEISSTQGAAGASAELFAGMAAVYRRLAATELGSLTPEDAAALRELEDVLRRLR
ncbi:NAD(P)-dependent oxidoreductase [Nocardioides sp.]|uniref:NAD(P)-dependent oxidoreductase n=1 Tax=Nocardioides sp. TaxID=35761 RepID=UPI002ED32688